MSWDRIERNIDQSIDQEGRKQDIIRQSINESTNRKKANYICIDSNPGDDVGSIGEGRVAVPAAVDDGARRRQADQQQSPHGWIRPIWGDELDVNPTWLWLAAIEAMRRRDGRGLSPGNRPAD